MKKMKQFRAIEKETTIERCGEESKVFTISAVCDHEGMFEITISGNYGKGNALRAIDRLKYLISRG